MQIKCPGCMAPIKAPDNSDQTSVTCEYCGNVVTLEPAAHPIAPQITSVAPTPTPPANPIPTQQYKSITVSPKSKSTVIILVIFLGLLGAHRFYAGKNGTAIVMLILSITVIGLWISAFWALIDFITIIQGKFTDQEGRPIKE